MKYSNKSKKKKKSKFTKQKVIIFLCEILILLSIPVCLLFVRYNVLKIEQHKKEPITINDITYNAYVQDNNEIMERYKYILQVYHEILEKTFQNENKVEIDSIKEQIDEINLNINDMKTIIEKIDNAYEESNKNTIVTAMITGICTIIAAVIGAGAAIIVAAIKNQNET